MEYTVIEHGDLQEFIALVNAAIGGERYGMPRPSIGVCCTLVAPRRSPITPDR